MADKYIPTWEDTEEITPKWEDTVEIEKPSLIDTTMRGVAQGATLGFADELSAGVNALKDITTTDRYELKDLPELYEFWKKNIRDRDRESFNANPKAAMASQIVGSLTTAPLMPASALNTVKGASAMGAAAGLGTSEADNLADLAKDTAIGGAIGGAVQFGVNHAGKAAKDFVVDKGKKLFNLATELPDDAIKAIKENPGLYHASKNAKTINQLTDGLENGLNDYSKIISDKSANSWNALKELDEMLEMNGIEHPASKDGALLGWFGDEIAENLNLKGSNQQAQTSALTALKKAQEDAKNITNYQDLKKFIQGLDSNINWDSSSDSLKNKALQQYRLKVDEYLKQVDDEYPRIMKEVTNKTNNLQMLKNKFSLKPQADEFGNAMLRESDTTASNVDKMINQALGGKKDVRLEALRDVSPQLEDDFKASALRRMLDKDTARGSRSAIVGGALGLPLMFGDLATGGMASAAGAVGGYLKDKYGREVGARAIDWIAHGDHSWINKMGKYTQPLVEAAKRGNQSLAATHFLLMQKDPEYRKLMDSGNDN